MSVCRSKMKGDEVFSWLDPKTWMKSSRFEQILQDLEHKHMRMCQKKEIKINNTLVVFSVHKRREENGENHVLILTLEES